MPYFDNDGNEVEGLLTAEESQAKIDEATKESIESAATAKVTAEAAATKATEDLAVLQKQIDDAGKGDGDDKDGDGDKNLANMRKLLDEQKTAADEASEATTARIAALEGDKVGQAISAVAGEDEELAKKIRHNYDKTLSGVKADTAEEVSEKVANAVKLSTTVNNPNPMDIAGTGAPQGNGGAHAGGANNKVDFNKNEVDSGKMLGISDADREKYGSDDRLTKMNTK